MLTCAFPMTSNTLQSQKDSDGMDGIVGVGGALKEMVTPTQAGLQLVVQAALGETTATATLKVLERLVVERLLLMTGAQASTRTHFDLCACTCT